LSKELGRAHFLILILSTILTLTSLVGAAFAASASDWTMFLHDPAHLGYSVSSAPSVNATLWTYKTGGRIYSGLAVADGRVFLGCTDNKVYCLNATSGSFIWSFVAGDQVWSTPSVVDGMVYFGSHDRNVY
jgi:outer membrane protein assembly factor BamB